MSPRAYLKRGGFWWTGVLALMRGKPYPTDISDEEWRYSRPTCPLPSLTADPDSMILKRRWVVRGVLPRRHG